MYTEKSPDYDNVFKRMKMKIRDCLFLLSLTFLTGIILSEGYLTENETADGSKKIEEQISDFLIRIGREIYLLECQSYDESCNRDKRLN